MSNTEVFMEGVVVVVMACTSFWVPLAVLGVLRRAIGGSS